VVFEGKETFIMLKSCKFSKIWQKVPFDNEYLRRPL
jgi:hypothetical protein